MNGEGKSRITVDIFGSQYNLLGHSSAQFMKTIAALVDDHMHRVAQAFPRLDTTKIAVLASMNVAEEYMKMRNEIDQHLRKLEAVEHVNRELEHTMVTLNELRTEHVLLQQHLEQERAMYEGEILLLRQEIEESKAQRDAFVEEKNQLREQQQSMELTQSRLEMELREQGEELANAKDAHKRILQSLSEIEQSNTRVAATSEDGGVQEQYRLLQIEYEKLKSEYHEWIELVFDDKQDDR